MENFRFSAVAKAWEHKPVEVKPMNVSVPTFFGRQVFTRERMRDYIAEQTLEQLFDAIDNNKPIGRELAGSVAIGMKKWAMEQRGEPPVPNRFAKAVTIVMTGKHSPSPASAVLPSPGILPI